MSEKAGSGCPGDDFLGLGKGWLGAGGTLWEKNHARRARRGNRVYNRNCRRVKKLIPDQYYGGSARTHGEPANLPQGGLFRLVQRVEGFVSADAGPRGGTFTTPPVVFSGKRLEFNLNASALGS